MHKTKHLSVPSQKSEPKGLNSRHREVIRRIVYFQQTQKQIAEDLGFNYQYLSVIVNTPLFKSELEKEYREKAKADRSATIEALADPAIEVARRALTKGEVEFDNGRVVKIGASVLMETVRDVLDRAGHKPIEKKIEAHFDFAAPILEAYQMDIDPFELENAQQVIDVTPIDGSESGPPAIDADAFKRAHSEDQTPDNSRREGQEEHSTASNRVPKCDSQTDPPCEGENTVPISSLPEAQSIPPVPSDVLASGDPDNAV